jgi:hypothetical protein
MAKNTLGIVIPEPANNEFEVEIIGSTSLIEKDFSAKDLKSIEDGQQGVAKPKKEPRKPKEEFERARIRNSAGQDCVKTIWFKKAMAAMGGYFGIPRGTVEQGIYVIGDLIPIKHSAKTPTMRSDRVNLNQGMVKKTSVAYRPEFHNWSCKLRIGFDSSVLTPQQVLSLLAHAGMKNGVGEWRPQKGGDHGRFTVLPVGKHKTATPKDARKAKRKVTTAAEMVANKIVRRPKGK